MKTRVEIKGAISEAFNALGDIAKRERVETYRLMRTVEYTERTCGGVSGKRVLELGSSLGVNLISMKHLGAKRAVGLDYFVFPEAGSNDFYIAPDVFQSLQTIWAKERVEVIRHHLGRPLPFEDQSFDLVICNAVIEHLHGIHRLLFHEVQRVLAPAGHFVFTTPNLASLLKRARFLLGRSPNWDIEDYLVQGENFTGHIREFTVAECCHMLMKAGFTDIQVKAAPGYFKWRWLSMPKKWHKFLFQLVARPFRTLGDLVYASGKKP